MQCSFLECHARSGPHSEAEYLEGVVDTSPHLLRYVVLAIVQLWGVQGRGLLLARWQGMGGGGGGGGADRC